MKSNCLIQAIKGKIQTKGSLFIVVPNDKTERGVPHFIWSDGDGYKHFTFNAKRKMKHWYQFILFDGHIEDFPVEFLKNVSLKKII